MPALKIVFKTHNKLCVFFNKKKPMAPEGVHWKKMLFYRYKFNCHVYSFSYFIKKYKIYRIFDQKMTFLSIKKDTRYQGP